uniref:RRM domain-containing protein n=1 Tax=Craspedostauros australis TaxID=1486917 RepID=A0A7R9WTN4_9STRA
MGKKEEKNREHEETVEDSEDESDNDSGSNNDGDADNSQPVFSRYVEGQEEDEADDDDDDDDSDGEDGDEDNEDDEDDEDDAQNPEVDEEKDRATSFSKNDGNVTSKDKTETETDKDKTAATRKSTKKVHRLSLKKTEDFNAKLLRRGVVYIARIPPKMTPTKVKALLSQFAEVTRVYLVEEDATVRKRRKKNGGGGGKRYIEGWIEFASKRKAKRIAHSLNTTPISTYKRDPHCGDLWNLKYLSKFKWSHLTEKVAYERRVREQKLRVEMMQARRENAAYVHMVETGKKLDRIEERKRKRGEAGAVSYKEGRKGKHSRHNQTRPIDGHDKKAAKTAVLAGLV